MYYSNARLCICKSILTSMTPVNFSSNICMYFIEVSLSLVAIRMDVDSMFCQRNTTNLWWLRAGGLGIFSCTASVRTGLALWTSGYIIGIFIRLFRDVLYPCRFRRTLPRRPPLLHSLWALTARMRLSRSASSSSQRYRRFSPLAFYKIAENDEN